MLLDRSDAELLQGGRSASEWAEKCRTNVHLPLEDISIHGETSLNSPGRDFWWVQAAFSSTWPPRFCETGRPTREAEENWFIGKNKMHITFFQLSYASCDCMELRVIAFAWTKQHDKVPDYRWLMITLQGGDTILSGPPALRFSSSF